MNIEPGIVILILILAAVVWYGITHKAKVQSLIDDLKDDGKLNRSNVQSIDHPAIVTAALQGAAEFVAAARAAPAPAPAQPAAVAVAEIAAIDPRILAAPDVVSASITIGRGLSDAEVSAWLAAHPGALDPRTVDAGGRLLEDVGQVDTTARPLPAQWDNAAWRGIVQFRKGDRQAMAFTYKEPFKLHLDPAAGDRRNARYSVTLAEAGSAGSEILAGSFGVTQIKDLMVGGQYEIGITSDSDSRAWVILG